MPVKSWVTEPAQAAAGRVEIRGVAMGGGCRPARVEVTFDDGVSWTHAQFDGPDLGPYAWRTFRLLADLPAGTYRVASRATNEAGMVQPATAEPNEQGFGHNGWIGHAMEMRVS